jgi:hypothetical protein
MVSIIAGEEIPQGVPVFHSGYGGTDHVSVPVSGHRDSVVADRGVVTTAHDLARGKRATTLASCLSHEAIKRAFEPFLAVMQDSPGLGLCMSQSMATAHGGEFWPERKPRITVLYLSVRTALAEDP